MDHVEEALIDNLVLVCDNFNYALLDSQDNRDLKLLSFLDLYLICREFLKD